jgi:imidazolonepropionase-like amidohydrolase
MHVHFNDPINGKLFVANGVTGVRVMWGNPRFGGGVERLHSTLRDAYDKGDQVGPRMVIASTILDGPKPVWPTSAALATPTDGRAAVVAAKQDGADFIKVYSLLPRDVYFAIADESKKQGLPFVGHVPEAVSVAEASDAGQKSIEHLTGMLLASSSHEERLLRERRQLSESPMKLTERFILMHRQAIDAAGSWDEAKAQALFAKLKANGTWQTPTLTVLHNMAYTDDPERARDARLKFVSPFVRGFWDPKQDFRLKDRKPEQEKAQRQIYDKQVAIVGKMYAAGVPLLAGTDEMNPFCFAGFSLHDELAALVQAGLTPGAALAAATINPARYFGWEAKMGSVAPGKVADLVVLDGDPLTDIGNTTKIAMVVTRGRLYERAELDRLLADVAQAAAPPAPAPGPAGER